MTQLRRFKIKIVFGREWKLEDRIEHADMESDFARAEFCK